MATKADPKLPRQIELNSRGRDVRALKRALKKAGFLAKDANVGPTFDSATDAAVRAFQKEKKLEIDGQVGPDTFAALLPSYDRYGRWLVSQVKPNIVKGTRQRIVATAFVGYSNSAALHYTQDTRRMEGVRTKVRPPKFPAWEDCSSFATWCYWAAGAPDPNGLGFNGQGYTGTQVANGKATNNPRPGDLVFYGGGAVPGHVAVYVGNGRVVSHGSEKGPYLLGIDYRSDRSQVRSYLP
ncbi:MAG TPA: peptidoglycan-binding protein [Gaiellaceae bacterium]|jgi:peptidoglycan hydrolase-like protein with peptidoglycan-binding domain